ncbi:MAG: hypothetical protein KAS72_10580 [Phycisphaerales bacterium]|nr:hypothetical protein [Phycisphaerales bacterium]
MFLPLVILLAVMGGVGYLGWRVGGVRLGVFLLPLILAGLGAMWIGPLLFHLGLHRVTGLVGPPAIGLVIGLAAGEALRWWVRKKLAKDKDRHVADRIGGAALGALLAIIIVWVGAVFVDVLGVRQRVERGVVTATPTASHRLAHGLGSSVVSLLPSMGHYARDLNLLVELAATSDGAKQAVVDDLDLDRLRDLPEVQAIKNDARTRADLELAQQGSITALLRLQRNPLILDLIEADEVRCVVDEVTIEDLAEQARAYDDASQHGG